VRNFRVADNPETTFFKTLKRAIDGKPFKEDRLARTAKMSKETEQIVEHIGSGLPTYLTMAAFCRHDRKHCKGVRHFDSDSRFLYLVVVRSRKQVAFPV